MSRDRCLARLLLAAGGMVLLSACSLAPDTPEAELDVPQSFQATNATAVAAWPSADWWQAFGSAELDDLIKEAEDANLDLAAAAARIEEADAQVRVSSAPLLPAVGFTNSASREQSSNGNTSGTSNRSSRGAFTLLSTSLSASYELDFWGKNRAALEAAKQTAVASRFDQAVVALSTVSSVADTYFQVLAFQDRVRIAQENLRLSRNLLDVIKERVAVGTASGLDLAQQQTVVAQQLAAIPPLEEQLRQNKNALAILIALPPERVHVEGGTMQAIAVPEISPGLPSALLARRPDVLEAEAKLAAARANVQVARAAMFPSIQLTAQSGYESQALSSLVNPAAAFYALTASLTQPIFEGYSLEGALELQRSTYGELLQTYRKAVLTAFEDVENALIAAQQTALQEKRQQAVVASAQRAYQLSEVQLREGTVDITLVLIAEQALFQNEDALAQVRLAHLQAAVALFQALGGGWSSADVDKRERAVPVPERGGEG